MGWIPWGTSFRVKAIDHVSIIAMNTLPPFYSPVFSLIVVFSLGLWMSRPSGAQEEPEAAAEDSELTEVLVATESETEEDQAPRDEEQSDSDAGSLNEGEGLPVSPLPDLLPPAAAIVPGIDDRETPVPAGMEGEDGTTADAEGATTELVLKDGRVLRDYQVHSWNKTALTIFHSTGAANVPAHLLPAPVVKAYHMDPKLSLEEEEADRVQRTEQAVANLRAMDERRVLRKLPSATLEGSVSMVKEEGVVLSVEEPEGLEGKDYQRIGGMIYDKAGEPVPEFRGQIFGEVWVTGHPLQEEVVDGDLLRFQGRVQGRHQVEGKTYPSVRFEKAAP